MKRLILAALLMLSPLAASAQGRVVDRLPVPDELRDFAFGTSLEDMEAWLYHSGFEPKNRRDVRDPDHDVLIGAEHHWQTSNGLVDIIFGTPIVADSERQPIWTISFTNRFPAAGHDQDAIFRHAISTFGYRHAPTCTQEDGDIASFAFDADWMPLAPNCDFDPILGDRANPLPLLKAVMEGVGPHYTMDFSTRSSDDGTMSEVQIILQDNYARSVYEASKIGIN